MHALRLCRGLAAAGLALAVGGSPAGAASHREAPLMALDPGADITDVYAFVGYDAQNVARPLGERRVMLIMNVVPGQEPGAGPNYFAFDDNVLYALHVDNNKDGVAEDVSYEFRFRTETTNPAQFLATLGGGPLPAIATLDAAGLARKQRYTVTEVRCRKEGKKCDRDELFDGDALATVPSNIGGRTMPDYEALAAQGIFTDADTGIRVFAGQRAETFAIDLGAVFDTVFLRRPLPALTPAEDAADGTNAFGFNNFSGFNINTIAIEVPVTRLTVDGKAPTAATGTLGVYASTARQQETVRRGAPAINPRKPPKDLLKGEKRFVQVSRMGNPLVNELIIPIGRKDLWNATEPEDEAQFLDAYRNLAVADALHALFPAVDIPAPPRNDVVHLLTQYADQDVDKPPFAELLRLDTTVAPTPATSIKRLGPFAHDALDAPTPDMAGFPNGRRPDDDVTDLVVRVAGGANYVAAHVGDGVGVNEKGVTPDFPFLPTPYDGRNRRHRDPGE